MDQESNIYHRFRDVFAFLSKEECNIPDDAILHLFSDVISSKYENKKSIDERDIINFLCDVIEDHIEGIINLALDVTAWQWNKMESKKSIDESGVINFLCDMTENHNDGIINLALDVTAWLGSSEDYFTHYQIYLTQFIRNVWNKIGLDNVSVASALFNCLTRLTEHKSGLEWLINENEDIHRDWLKILETGSSIFLQKAVIGYITRLCTTPGNQSHQSTIEKIIKDDILPIIKKYRDNLEEKRKTYPRSYILSLLQLLEGMCSSKIICDMMVPTALFDDLSTIICLGEKLHADAALTVIKVVYNTQRDLVEPTIDQLTHDLLLKGDVLKAQTVLLIRFKGENLSDSETKEIFQAPIQFVLNLLDEENGCDKRISLSCLYQQMSSKQKLTFILCKSVANMALVKLEVPDLVTKLLVSTMSDGTDCQKGFIRFLKHNDRIQKTCLEYLSNVQNIVQNRSLLTDIVSCIIPMISQTSVDSQLYSVCMKCLLPIMPALLDKTNGFEEIQGKLALILQQQLCSVSWEQRDTTLELLSDLIRQHKENDGVLSWVEKNKLHHHVWQCKDDGESYVRATAIRCLYHVSTCTRLWTSLLGLVGLSEEGFVETISDALESDTEAFVRRSAANFLNKFYLDRVNYQPSPIPECIAKKMSSRIHDFDWEVKLQVLAFLNSVFDQELTISPESSTLPEYAKILVPNGNGITSLQTNGKQNLCLGLKKCHNLGCLQALLTALNDYDSKVLDEAVKGVCCLKQRLKSTCDNVGASKQEILDHLQDNITSLTEKDCINGSTKSDSNEGRDEVDNGDKIGNCVKRILNFDENRHNENCIDKADYTKNPISIIEDILSYGQKNEEDNIVDCY